MPSTIDRDPTRPRHFHDFLKKAIGEEEHREFAARCGISPSQLSKVLRGQQCERATLAKIIAGVSTEPGRQAECLACFLRDMLPVAGKAGERVRISVGK